MIRFIRINKNELRNKFIRMNKKERNQSISINKNEKYQSISTNKKERNQSIFIIIKKGRQCKAERV